MGMMPVTCVVCTKSFGPKNYNSRICRVCAINNKWCSDCQSALPRSMFTSDMQRRCASCARDYAYWYRKGMTEEEKLLASRRRAAHRCGISVDEYNSLLEYQGGLCLICQKAEATDLDHCRFTKTVRGLLCGKCNRGIGMFEDDTEVLERAIAYLKGDL